jgi:hypothetical protein
MPYLEENEKAFRVSDERAGPTDRKREKASPSGFTAKSGRSRPLFRPRPTSCLKTTISFRVRAAAEFQEPLPGLFAVLPTLPESPAPEADIFEELVEGQGAGDLSPRVSGELSVLQGMQGCIQTVSARMPFAEAGFTPGTIFDVMRPQVVIFFIKHVAVQGLVEPGEDEALASQSRIGSYIEAETSPSGVRLKPSRSSGKRAGEHCSTLAGE